MNKSGFRLPDISAIKNTENEFDKAKKMEIAEQSEYAMSIFFNERKKSRTYSQVRQIPAEMLYAAPKKFFDKYDDLVSNTTRIIRESLSKAGKTNAMAKVHANPDNNSARKEAEALISNELLSSDVNRLFTQETQEERELIYSLAMNELLGMGPLEPLWLDKSVTEIMCNGPYDIQVERGGQIYRVPSAHFRDDKHMMDLLIRLYNSINKDISATVPKAQGRLHDNSRIHAVVSPVSPTGANFNIRRHSEAYWTPQDVINKGTVSEELMAYLGNLIYAGASFLIIGGTGTGKTTLLNSLTGFFKETDRIVTLEKSLELKPHPNKLFAAPMETVPRKQGTMMSEGVNMRELVEAAMIMRPDGIIIGEVIDGAAYDLCQALNTGHWGASTVHADDAEAGITRLMSLVSQEELVKGEAIYQLIAAAFDFIVVIDRFDDGSRKISEVHEVARKPERNKEDELILPTIPLWVFVPEEIDYSVVDEKSMEITGEWVQENELSAERQHKLRLALKRKLSWEELRELSSVKEVIE